MTDPNGAKISVDGSQGTEQIETIRLLSEEPLALNFSASRLLSPLTLTPTLTLTTPPHCLDPRPQLPY